MTEPKPSRSWWVFVILAVLVLAVVMAKRGSSHRRASRPEQSPAPALSTGPAAARRQVVPVGPPAPSERGRTTPPVKAAQPRQVTRAASQPAGVTPAAPRPQQESPPSAALKAAETPKKIGQPLPGSKLQQALSSGRPTVADFGAGWCKACKMMEPVLAEAAGKYEGKINIVFINTDEYPSVAKQYRISAIPTQVFLDIKGKEVDRHVGYYPLEEFEAQLGSTGMIK